MYASTGSHGGGGGGGGWQLSVKVNLSNRLQLKLIMLASGFSRDGIDLFCMDLPITLPLASLAPQ